MKALAQVSGRVLMTLAMLACAAVLGWHMWDYYMGAPWTRDGHVRADVIGVTPDVSGMVSAVMVHDDQLVKAGDVLFQIDPERFRLALRQAEASVASAAAALEAAKADMERYDRLAGQNFASQQTAETARATLHQDEAAHDSAIAARDLAQLNLDRATVRATVDGRITNLSLRPGDYATAGEAMAALIATDSIYVAGYFEETKLHHIHPGDPASVVLMGGGRLSGHVTSIAGGIEDQERSDTAGALADVTATFAWVRLAQRVPVRITLDDPAIARDLVVGRTATVQVLPRD